MIVLKMCSTRHVDESSSEETRRMEPNRSSLNTHEWIVRRLELAPGHPVVQQLCRKCGRAFVEDVSTGERKAVHVSVFKLNPLAIEVTDRWLSENCPTERLTADEADRRQISK
jgi:hypothetical protein